jgi:hypothetical protein
MIREIIVWDKFKNLETSLATEKVDYARFEMNDNDEYYELMIGTDVGINFRYMLFKEDETELQDYEDNHKLNYISIASVNDYDKYKDKKDKPPK